VNFFRPIIDKKSSTILGKEQLLEIVQHLKQNHNVVFLANHQTEADPQAIAVLLEEEFPSLAEKMIFVAGERVVTDILAIPFSMGCDLICIYSKRYIDHPPELKLQKQLHNKKSMSLMSELLSEGGKCIYVAPSGGRDRRNAQGEIEIAPFDPKSIEMFYLMAKKSKTPTYFYPMALGTYELLPPPEKVQIELGEHRALKRVGIHMAIGPQIDMDHFPGSDNPNKDVRRKSRSDYIWKLVHDDYRSFQGEN
jgi:glycerol-3-phosphate O-acyltransferase